jgi:hypothetical protein
MGELATVVILSEAKNLIISNESTTEILRLSPQNDITTQSLRGRENHHTLHMIPSFKDISHYPRFFPLQGGGHEGDGVDVIIRQRPQYLSSFPRIEAHGHS